MAPDLNDPSSLEIKSLTKFLRNYFPHQINHRGKANAQLLIFDQLEELFNLYLDPSKWYEQQEDFFMQVADALESDPLLRVVFIIREDYFAQLDPFAAILPEKLKSRFRLERLRKAAALDAIRGPLEKAKNHVDEGIIDKVFDEGIIDKLIEDLLKIRVETFGDKSQEIKGEFVESIQLQLVCQRLWDKLKISQIDQITKDYFSRLVDVDKALEDFYLEAIHEASESTGISEGVIRNWFEKKLITSSGTRGIVHREFQSTGEITNSVVDILERRYIIRKEERSGAKWYELTHDRLIGPIIDSNKWWREEQWRNINEKRQRTRRKLKIILPILTIVTILSSVLIVSYVASPSVNTYTNTNSVFVNVIPVGGSPRGVAVNPVTNMIYVVNGYDNTMSVIDSRMNKVVETVDVGKKPTDVAVNPVTNMIYVVNRNDNTTSVIDGKTNRIESTIPVGGYPQGVAVNPATNMIYTANYGDDTVSVIDSRMERVMEKVSVGTTPISLAVNPSTNMIYVVTFIDNTLSVIDGKTNRIESTIPVGSFPFDVAVNPSTNMIYVVNGNDNTMSVIDGKTNRIESTIPVGGYPEGVAVNPATNMIYTANSASNSVTIINGSTNKINTTLTGLPARPNAISVNSQSETGYIVNDQANNTYFFHTSSVTPQASYPKSGNSMRNTSDLK